MSMVLSRLLLVLCVAWPFSVSARTVQETARLALAFSPELKESVALYEAARLDADEARAARWPVLELGASSARYGIGDSTNSNGGEALSLTGRYTLYDAGWVSANVDETSALQMAGEQRLVRQRESVVLDAVSVHLDVLRQQALLLSAEDSVAAHDRIVQRISDIAAVDRGRSGELVQARARLERAKATVVTIRGRLAQAHNDYRRLTGEEATNLESADVLSALQAVLPSGGEWMYRQPDWLEAQAKAKAAEASAERIAAEGMPRLSLDVSQSTARDVNGERLSPTVGLSSTWTAFRGFGQKAARDAAMSRSDAARARVKLTEKELLGRLHLLREQVLTEQDRGAALLELERSSDEVRSNYWEQFTAARRSLLDVLNAEKEYFDVRADRIGSGFDSLLARARYHAQLMQLESFVRP